VNNAAKLMAGLAGLLLIGTLLAQGDGSAQPTPTDMAKLGPVITVSGTGNSELAPDQATLSIGITAREKTAKAAQNAVNEQIAKIIAGVTPLVGEKKYIQTSNFSLYPEYANNENVTRVVAYNGNNTLTIQVNKIANVGPVIDAAVAAGATNIQGISFGLQDSTAARNDALRNAVKDAKGKATAMAEAAGMKLGDLIEINENGGFMPSPVPMFGMAESRMASKAASVEPGQVSLAGTVTVRYRLRTN
jgi:uncharacterized protein YggE